jgi:hypothetical protein
MSGKDGLKVAPAGWKQQAPAYRKSSASLLPVFWKTMPISRTYPTRLSVTKCASKSARSGDKQANVSAVSSFEDRVVVLLLRFGEFIGLDSGGSISGSFGGPLRFGESLFHVSGLQIGGSSLDLHDRVLRSNERVLLRRDAQLVSNDSSLTHTDQQCEPAEPSSESSVFRAFLSLCCYLAASSSLFGVGWTWTISGACAVPRRSPAGWPYAPSGWRIGCFCD